MGTWASAYGELCGIMWYHPLHITDGGTPQDCQPQGSTKAIDNKSYLCKIPAEIPIRADYKIALKHTLSSASVPRSNAN